MTTKYIWVTNIAPNEIPPSWAITGDPYAPSKRVADGLKRSGYLGVYEEESHYEARMAHNRAEDPFTH